MNLLEYYTENLIISKRNKLPLLPISINLGDIDYNIENKRLTTHTLELTDLLIENGIDFSLLGSLPIYLKYGLNRILHDVDFAIPKNQLGKLKSVLLKNSFNFWCEDNIHKEVMALTGGKGRHHNYGASHQDLKSMFEKPIWIGFFIFDQEEGLIKFYENFAVSDFKLNHYNSTIQLPSPSFLGDYKQDILFDESFFNGLNSDSLNALDISRRDKILSHIFCQGNYNLNETFHEFSINMSYPITAEEYLFSSKCNILGKKVYCVIPEITFLRLSEKKFCPHFLGIRDKYKVLTNYLLSKECLDHDYLSRLNTSFEHSKNIFDYINRFVFTQEHTTDIDWFVNYPMNFRSKSEPDYSCFLIEGVHFNINKGCEYV
jgi:hypothetical protein